MNGLGNARAALGARFSVDLSPSDPKRMVPIMSSPAAKYPITGLTSGGKLKKKIQNVN